MRQKSLRPCPARAAYPPPWRGIAGKEAGLFFLHAPDLIGDDYEEPLQKRKALMLCEEHVIRHCGVEALPGEGYENSKCWGWLRSPDGMPVEGLPEPTASRHGLRRYQWADGSAIVTDGDEAWFLGIHATWLGARTVRMALEDAGENLPAEIVNPGPAGLAAAIRPGSVHRITQPRSKTPARAPSDACKSSTAPRPLAKPSETLLQGAEALHHSLLPETGGGGAAPDRPGTTETAGKHAGEDLDLARFLSLPEPLSDNDLLVHAAFEFGRLWETARRQDSQAFRQAASRLRALLAPPTETQGHAPCRARPAANGGAQ